MEGIAMQFMDDVSHSGESGECCTACGSQVEEQAVYYFSRARVCGRCFEDMNEGAERVARCLNERPGMYQDIRGAFGLFVLAIGGVCLYGCIVNAIIP
jgi:predicted amidophosphoribosyltransferase